MLILALDTTTAAASVALAEGDRLLEIAAIDGSQPIATRVPGDLMALLARHDLTVQRIDLFAVAIGPGSFTGLRIGIAAMQGLALANARPLVGVSAFDALAALANGDPAAGGLHTRVAIWIDAWRGEVYGATYARHAGSDAAALRQVVEPAVAPPEHLLRTAMSSDTRRPPADPGIVVFIGDGAVKYRARIPGHVIEPTPLIAGAISCIAHARAARGESPPPHAIGPLYVRRPDAELARERR